MVTKNIKFSVVIEDEYNLVIVYPFSSPEKVKVFKVFNIKNTDE